MARRRGSPRSSFSAGCDTVGVESSAQWLPPQAPDPDPIAPDPEPAWKRILGPFAVVAVALAKFGKIALIALKGGKFATTALSMIVSVGAYTLIFGAPFAIGFVLLLYVHEMGHYIQLRREGVQPGRMIFIPLLGAVISARSFGGSALAEARVGLAGPILGSLGALLVAIASVLLHSQLLQVLAYTGFLLNLFNLLPVVPLDGGRAMAAMSPKMWWVGLAALIVLAVVFPNPIIFIILLFAALETYKRWKARRAGGEEVAAFYRVKPSHRLAIAVVYLGLIAICVIGMDLTHLQRSIPS
jgi:Zn-dependent protease